MRTRLAILAALALCACSTSPAPPERFYRVELPAASSATTFGNRIQVEPFDGFGIYNARPLLYLEANASGTVLQYHYQSWAEPPGVMLRDALIAYLRTALNGAQVEAAGGRTRADFTVHARIRRLDHLLGSPPQAHFAADFRVMDSRDEERVLHSFDEKAPAAGGSVEDYVNATDQLVAKAFAELATKIVALKSPPPASKPD